MVIGLAGATVHDRGTADGEIEPFGPALAVSV